MLDLEPATINITGEVRVSSRGVAISLFDCENASCRDLAALAMVWAIGELQRNLLALMEKPGGGNVTVDYIPTDPPAAEVQRLRDAAGVVMKQWAAKDDLALAIAMNELRRVLEGE
jgi:hypothetical protein